jgi:uncharacterized membrane protein
MEFLISAVALVLGIVGLNKIAVLDRKLYKLKMELGRLTSEAASPIPVQAAPAKKSTAKAAAAVPVVEAIKAPEGVTSTPSPPHPPEPKPISVAPRNVEQAIASRWFVWIGGVAIALGGLLFVKYAFDHHLISPALQIVVALIVAAILIFSGDRLRRSMPAGGEANHVPAALSAAGLSIAFGAVFAAYALYELVQPGTAFVGLGLIGLAALGLSLRQGPLIAALGLAGSYATPSLITSPHPNAWTFFPFLLIILVASFALLRKRPWWWLGYVGIAGSAVWSMLWMHGPFVASDAVPIGLFALAFGAVSFFAIVGRAALEPTQGSLLHPSKMSPTLQLGAVGAGVASLVLTLLVFKTQHGVTALILFGLGMAAISILSWFRRGETGAALAAAVLSLFVLVSWPHVSFLDRDLFNLWGRQSDAQNPLEQGRFLFDILAAGLAFTGLGLFGVYRKESTSNWALLAASVPATYIGNAWLNANQLLSERSWAALGIAAALLLLAVVYHRRAKLSEVGENFSLGLLSIGAAAMLWFAAHRGFEGVTLTIVIAALAFCFAFITRVLPVRMFGSIAGVFGSIVALRLFFSPQLWFDDRSLLWGQHWPLYGYGIPIVLFWFASRILRSTNHPRSATGLEAVSLGLLISLVSVEIRVLIGGGISNDGLSLLEMSSHFVAWLGGAYGLIYRQQIYSSFVSKWGSRILLGVSCLGLLTLSLFILNPIVSGDPVEGGALINTLWLAYLAPVVLLAMIARKLDPIGLQKSRSAFGILILVLVLAFVTLEVKRLFQGPLLEADFLSDAESYALSAAWLALAVALLIAGLRMNRKTIRYGGLAVMVLALLKTFAYDLWQLGGLWQIASVMGIGLSLVGIGWLYTKFIRPMEAAEMTN